MKEKETFKARIIRYAVYFLGIVLVCTIISRSIYDYLLPVVSTTLVSRGTVEVKQLATGKIGLDETQLKQQKVIVTSGIEGKIVGFNKIEGEYVEKGEVLGHIQKKVNSKVAYEQEVEQAQLSQEMAQILREKTQKQERIKALQEKYTQKEKELAGIEMNYQVVNLKEAIREQEKLIETNQALYEAGALSKQEQESSQTKLDELNRTLNETKGELEKQIKETLATYKEEIDGLQNETLNLEDQYTVNSKKSQGVEGEEVEENIVSPISGYIQTVNGANGAYVMAHEQLITIIPEGMENRLSFELSEEAASKVTVGQEVRFMWAQKPYEAKVIKKSFNETTGEITIFCDIAKEILEQMDLDYRSYRMVSVEATKVSEVYSMVLNNSALQGVENEYYVYVIEEKEQLGRKAYLLRKVNVQLLEEGDYKSAISGNIDETMKIVDGHLSELSDGQEVVLK